jgi:hypothetical protein
MREKLEWHLANLVEFYNMKLNCPNCKYSASIGYWERDKEEIIYLIHQLKTKEVFLAEMAE